MMYIKNNPEEFFPLDIDIVRKIPTCYDSVETGNTHESILRAWNILERVKMLLDTDCPPSIIRSLIKEYEK